MKKLVLALACRNKGSRLYGKPLQNLCIKTGYTILDNIIACALEFKCIDDIVLAISEGDENLEYIKYAENNNLKYIIGDQEDVLSRLIKCAQLTNATDILRTTSESPFPYFEILEDVLKSHYQNGSDATFIDDIIDGCGFEIISSDALRKSHKLGDARHRSELCTLFIRENIEQFKTKRIKLDRRLDREDLRLTVDNPEDLILCRSIYKEFEEYKPLIPLNKIIEFIDQNQNLKNIVLKYCNLGNSTMRITNKKSITGQKLYEKAKKIIPGGNMLLSKRPEMMLPNKWPTYFSKSSGCHLWDMDGNKYTDISLMGVGTNILGYNHHEIDEAVTNTIIRGNMTTLNCSEEVELSEKLLSLHGEWAEMVKLARSGGEANAIAIRIARAFTRKDKVAICGYHGWHDWYLSANIKNSESLDKHLLAGLESKGVPSSLKDTVYTFDYNDYEMLENIVKSNDIGIIKMEVSRNIKPKDDFLKNVRELANKNNIILIFDECTSGFRESFGGLHLKYGVDPDMAIFGKALGNGYAITAVLGRKEIMQEAQSTFISSTFWTERIGPTAAIKTLEIMKKEESWKKISNIGLSIKDLWSKLSDKYELPIDISGISALPNFSIISKNNIKYKTLITQEMLKKKILVSNLVFVSIVHTNKILRIYAKALDKAFSIINECEKGKNYKKILKTPVCHIPFKRMN